MFNQKCKLQKNKFKNKKSLNKNKELYQIAKINEKCLMLLIGIQKINIDYGLNQI